MKKVPSFKKKYLEGRDMLFDSLIKNNNGVLFNKSHGNLVDQLIIEIVKENDGIKYSEKKMIQMIDEAYSILKNFPDSEYKKSLISLLNYIIKRNI